ncbi:MAG: hypothetical protein A2X35_02125 [Elusimicrobia bacterium GWA2_61_42]|nr:MAG: hypothetical protein A2X35_02125 [Elusimicrobia bacterium GWA2_61_42]OGR79852.1 MAG: hypothetical protein A2X38_12140 [Elusimicrobia bacterium GWC2_61_25]
MNIKKVVIGLVAAMALAWAPAAYAADNSTEFGIADDLTVLGVEGSAADPDAEIKGFTVFGATQAAYTGAIAGAGNVVVNGYLTVSSGAYFVGGSTFASAGAYFTGISSFSNVGNIHIAGGIANQVLKKDAGGGMAWADDALGAGEISGTSQRLVMFQADGTGGADSLLQQDSGNTSITMISGSSVTIQGAFGATGNAALGGTLGLTGAATLGNNLTVAGVTNLNGLTNLGSNADDLLAVNAQASFLAGSTFTAGAYFQSVSSFSSPGNIHVGGGTVNQVLKKDAGGGMAWGDDNTGLTSLGTPRRLQMVNDGDNGLIDSVFQQNELDTNITMLATSSMTVLGALGAGGAVELGNTLAVADNVQLGNATSDIHGVNRAAEAGVALSVDSDGTPGAGKYAAKFYSSGVLAAWLKKK